MQRSYPVSSFSGTLRFALRRFVISNHLGWFTFIVTSILIDFASAVDLAASILAMLPLCAWFSNRFVWRWSVTESRMEPSDFWSLASPLLLGLLFAFLESAPKGSGLTPVHAVYVCIAVLFGNLVLRNRRAGAWKHETNERLGYS